jgi:hypothetical protein
MANLKQGGDRKSGEIKSSMETLIPIITIERAAELAGTGQGRGTATDTVIDFYTGGDTRQGRKSPPNDRPRLGK